VAMYSITDVLLRLIFVWSFMAWMGGSPLVAVSGNLLGAVLSVSVLLVGLHRAKSLHVSFRCDSAAAKQIRSEIMRLARPIVPSNILANITDMGNRYIIAALIGLHHAGLFVAAYGLVKRPYGMLSDIGFTAMTPAYSESMARKDKIATRRIKRMWMIGIAGFSLLGAFLFYLLKDVIVVVLLSEEYAEAGNYFFGIAAALAILNVNSVVNGLLLASNRTDFILYGSLISALVSTIVMLVLIPLTGLVGAVYGLFAGFVLQFVVLTLLSRRAIWMNHGNDIPDRVNAGN
jgi:O-antigen/teichoic acid export membrane protein